MNEERLKVLKMLKEGRITMEEAELLLDALESGASGEGSSGEKRHEEETSRGSSEHRHPFEGFKGIPEGLFNFDWKLGPKTFESGFREAMKGFEESMKDFARDFSPRDFAGGFKEMFGRSTGQSTKTIRISASGVTKVSIGNRWGEMRITGAETQEISGTAAITVWGSDEETATERAEEIELTQVREGDTLALRCEPPSERGHARFRVDLDLTMPYGLALEIKGMSGDLSVSGLRAGVAAASLSGDIIVQRSNGIMALESKSGDIEVLDCEGEVRVHTLSGDVDLERVRSVMVHGRSMSGDVRAEIVPEGEGAVELETTSGDLRLTLPEQAAINLEAATMSGAIDCGLPLDYTTRSSNRVVGSAGGGGTKVELHTKSGDILLHGGASE